MHKNILIVAAHPDDDVLGCGGTIARHVAAGDRVDIIYMADGLTSRSGNNETQSSDRNTACQNAREILGISQSFFLNLPDNKMDSLPLLDIVQAIEPLIQQLNPEVIYTHHQGDLNIDHQLTQQAVLTACRPQPGSSVKQIYSFEVLSSSEWANPLVNPFLVNHYVDITHYLDKKIAALKAYHHEMRTEPHSRSIEHVKTLALHRGSSVGLKAAEAFMLIRSIS